MKKHLFLALITILFSHTAIAEIYKHVDADGRVTYSNVKTKGAVKLEFDAGISSSGQSDAKKLHQISAQQRPKASHALQKMHKRSAMPNDAASCKQN